MSGQFLDMAIVGGGLAGGLTALAVHRARPDLRIALFEAGKTLGGNHRWSWFGTDLDAAGATLLAPFGKAEWSGYEVRFPAGERALRTSYQSMASTDFDEGLRGELPEDAIRSGCEVAKLHGDGVTLASGERIAARIVVDCRSAAPSPHLNGGWQVFLGRHLRCDAPHGAERPTIMDATVEQHGAYRFVYVLPLGERDIFVEDTYYADNPALDHAALAARIDAYCAARGWHGETMGEETGVLPVITGGDFTAFRAAQGSADVVLAGARGGFIHPLTSYTLPIAVRNALWLASDADRTGADLAKRMDARALAHWDDTGFYRLLGRMLFGAAEPGERYRIFERFYRLPEGLIERFYAARSTRYDRARILCGKPPVPVARAVGALFSPGAAMAARTTA